MPDHRSTTAISLPQTGAFRAQLTYSELLQHVYERRLNDPGKATHPRKVASNTHRALEAFMEANDLDENSPVGDELLGGHLEQALTRLSNIKAARGTRRRWRSEMKERIRPWAIEEARKRSKAWSGQTFAQRLDSLMREADESAPGLARALGAMGHTIHSNVIRNWRLGLRHPHPQSQKDRVIAIAQHLGVPASDLLEALPSRARQSQSYSALGDLDTSVRRRIAPHLPDDFDSRAPAEQDEIVQWVIGNCLCAPVTEMDGRGADRSTHALCRPGSSRRLREAPPHLVAEIDGLLQFKTSDLSPVGFQRRTTWKAATAESSEEHLMLFFGTCHELGVPDCMLSLSLVFAPLLIDAYIKWRVARRGGYTTAILRPLQILQGLLTAQVGYVRQQPGFGQTLHRLPGLVRDDDIAHAEADWDAACDAARAHITMRMMEVTERTRDTKGRDPFLAINAVLNDAKPAVTYYRIVHEIRRRMPDDTYAVRRAEALRALVLFRIGLATGFRQRNLRELRVNSDPNSPTPMQRLREARAGELHWNGSSWRIRMPRDAFKNSDAKALRGAERDFVLADWDGLYAELDAYLRARRTLLGEAEDPGLLFVKSIAGTRASDPTYRRSGFYAMFRAAIVTYGIYNPWRDEGAIEGLLPHGPHPAFRDIPATHLLKRNPGAGLGMAASFLLDSPDTVREHYARFIPADEHAAIAAILANDIEQEAA